MGRIKFLCVWSSGDNPSVPVYYRETPDGYWGATYDREEAKRFPSVAAAWEAWKQKHVEPERYQPSINKGLIRVEPENCPMFCFDRGR